MKKTLLILFCSVTLAFSQDNTNGGIRFVMDYGSLGNMYLCDGGCSNSCQPVSSRDGTTNRIKVGAGERGKLRYCTTDNSGSITRFAPKMVVYPSKYIEGTPHMGTKVLKHFLDFTTILDGGVGVAPFLASTGSLSIEDKDNLLRAISRYDRNSFMMGLNERSVTFWEKERAGIIRFVKELISGTDGKDRDMYEKKWGEIFSIIDAATKIYRQSVTNSTNRILSRDFVTSSFVRSQIDGLCSKDQCWLQCAKDGWWTVGEIPRYRRIYKKRRKVGIIPARLTWDRCISNCAYSSSDNPIGRVCTSYAHIFNGNRSGDDRKEVAKFGAIVAECVQNICEGGLGGLGDKIGQAKAMGLVFSNVAAKETQRSTSVVNRYKSIPEVKKLKDFYVDAHLREAKEYLYDDFVGKMADNTSGTYSNIVKYSVNNNLFYGGLAMAKIYATGAAISNTPPPNATQKRNEIPDGRTEDPEPPTPPFNPGGAQTHGSSGSPAMVGSATTATPNNRPIDLNKPENIQCGDGEVLYVIAVGNIGGLPKKPGVLQRFYDSAYGHGVIGTESGVYLSCGLLTESGVRVTKKLGKHPINHKEFFFAEEFQKCHKLTFSLDDKGEDALMAGECVPLHDTSVGAFTSEQDKHFIYSVVLNFKSGSGFSMDSFGEKASKTLFAARALYGGGGVKLVGHKLYRMVLDSTTAPDKDGNSSATCHVEEVSRDWFSYPDRSSPKGYRLEFKLAPPSKICDNAVNIFTTDPAYGGVTASAEVADKNHEGNTIASGNDSLCVNSDLIVQSGYIRKSNGYLLFAKEGAMITPANYSDKNRMLAMLNSGLSLEYELTPWIDTSMENPTTSYGQSIVQRIKTKTDETLAESKMLEGNGSYSTNRVVFLGVAGLLDKSPTIVENHVFVSYPRKCEPSEKHTVSCSGCSIMGGASASYGGETIR